MPTFSHGSKASLFLNGYELSAYLQSVSLSRTADVADSSALHTSAKVYVPGMVDATLSGDGLFDGALTALDTLWHNILGAATKSILSYLPHTEALGSVVYGLSVDEVGNDIEAATDDVSKLGIEAQSSVGADRCLTHKVLGAVSGSGNGTSIDDLVSSAFGGQAYLQVAAQSGGGTLTVKVQHSADDAAWADLITFTGVTVISAQRGAVTGTVNRYTRDNHAISAGSATYSMAFGRKVQ